ncbi:transcriptional regulator [Longispora fulva]|uniref:Putative NBD/HSP70 family sugar kinase n=1 Tax=Longispora fulva TaxID=619741 RepID=A0A8J7GEW2_9ACTN|nr:ROK family transcriptional regulator [Longispora fulva]MBG6134543.1 putative NBD/HSP70 family sugar kinase [Longispora fulva]GIG61749.1 transcriptional regulator [Longispora fulva]
MTENGISVIALPRSGDIANRASLRRTNMGLILRHLRGHGARSRTQLSLELGLPKATVSNLVNELVERRLVREGDLERDGAIGRPRQAVHLDGATICGLGVEISVDYARTIALNLRGDLLLDRRITITPGQDSGAVLDAVAGLIHDALTGLRADGLDVTGVTVATPGEVDRASGTVLFAANMGWTHLPVIAGLLRRLPQPTPPITLANDTKLGAIAEYMLAAPHGIHDLIYLTGDVGVGAGIIADGKPLLGAAGIAGEVGHMPLDLAGYPCACGRSGCWETMIGLNALMRHAADPDDPVCDPTRDLEDRIADIRARADAGDERTLAALDRIAHGLGLGIGLLIDVLNPRAVIVGGYFALLSDYLLTTTRRIVNERVMAPRAGGCEVLTSTLGFTSAARGGAHAALDAVFDDPGSFTAPLRGSR